MLEVEIRLAAGSFDLEVAFTAPSRGTVALFGRSGAGKTTLLNALAGLVTPRSGRIAVDASVFFSSADRICLPIEQRGLGYVFQEGRLFPHLSVAQNLDYGAKRAVRRAATVSGLSDSTGASGRLQRDEVIDLLSLDKLIDRRTATLSGGECQRVAIGRALLAQPRLLLLDEPLAALDQARKLEIMDYIERLRRITQIPIVLVSHAIEEVARLSDFMVVLDQGRLCVAGPTREVMTSPQLLATIGAQEASCVVDGVVTAIFDADGLAHIKFAGGVLKVGARGRKAGEEVRLRVLAGDVALSLSVPQDISISNVIAAIVLRIEDQDDHRSQVFLDLNGVPLIAAVTRESVRRLGLVSGCKVYALIKSIALIEANPVA